MTPVLILLLASAQFDSAPNLRAQMFSPPRAQTPMTLAQVFSPGELSRGHKDLDGLTGCTKCHGEGGGGRHDNNKCLECHKEIARSLDAALGYHRRVKAQLCAECHREHRGARASLIDWQGGRDLFNHGLTGWPLKGAHRKPECRTCHETRRITDDDIKALVDKTKRETYLGLSTRCVSCHFDEHRGQEGKECQSCHTTENFKEAPGFNHNNRAQAKFPLVGEHKKVQCKACHDPISDPNPAPDFPKPKSDLYLQLEGIPHAQCVSCHSDFHRGKFGKNCVRCHTPDGWRIIKETAEDTGFHDKHAFKLRGMHESVSCKECHGSGSSAKFKGLRFQKCVDCHMDSHVGQIAPRDGALRCEDCHDVNGFLPVNFDIGRHDKTRFPLQQAHRTVQCNECHKSNARLKEKVPSRVRNELASKGRRILVSDAIISMPDVISTKPDKLPLCDTCHDDVHNGQFAKAFGAAPGPIAAARECNDCHQMSSFVDLKFNHDNSRFPLTGKHAKTSCADCHSEGKRGKNKETAVIYRPLALECQSCHADEHVGQLAKNNITDCATCHSTTGFKQAKFDHDKQSVFPLVGRHKTAKCDTCHPNVDVKGDTIARYKPLPATCAGCHEDEHKNTFDEFDPTIKTALTDVKLGAASKPGEIKESNCQGCHTPAAWMPAKFAHERTGFALTGKHQKTLCVECHGSDTKRPQPQTCNACHTDPHAQEFGTQCAACHTTEAFTGPAFPVDAHRRTNFPLVGRHAALPCDECHVGKRERTFSRAALDCVQCHRADSLRASLVTVDHGRAPFNAASCRACHLPTTFSPAQFIEHEPCFPIQRGVHAPVRCNECHAGLIGAPVTGTCRGVVTRCTECHIHVQTIEDPRHVNVPGYEFKSAKCTQCHRPL